MQEIAQGRALLGKGSLVEALRLSRRLAALHPDNPQVLEFAADTCRAAGDLQVALNWVDRAIAAGADPALLLKKAWLLSEARQRDELPALMMRIAEQADGDGLLLWRLGKLHYVNNQLEQAIARYQRALTVIGEHPGLLYDLAITRFFRGDFEQAEQVIERLLSVDPKSGQAMYLRATLRRQRPDANHVADIRARLAQGIGHPRNEAAALYALGKELEDLGEHADAFAAFQSGARLLRTTLRYDVSSAVDSLEQIRQTFDTRVMAEPVPGHDEEGAIFIVGMPRSGTTLAERMLLQSGRVRAAGELMDFGYLLTSATLDVRVTKPTMIMPEASLRIDFAALGREYMRGARQMAGGSQQFIDKLPTNYMYCGMIRKALPRARIIHMSRDPLDACYAVFKTLFFGAYEFSYDLDELAQYYIAYHRTMQHWHEVMPGSILDVRYENLVRDTETEVRRIYDWCGLQWDPAALAVPEADKVFASASAAQVREPIHARSVGSWRRHQAAFSGLVDKLVAAGVVEA